MKLKYDFKVKSVCCYPNLCLLYYLQLSRRTKCVRRGKNNNNNNNNNNRNTYVASILQGREGGGAKGKIK